MCRTIQSVRAGRTSADQHALQLVTRAIVWIETSSCMTNPNQPVTGFLGRGTHLAGTLDLLDRFAKP